MTHFNRWYVPLLVIAFGGCQNLLATPQTAPSTSAETPNASAPTTYWGKWDAASDPVALGNKVIDDLIPREFSPDYRRRGGMDYREVCTAYGSVRFAGTLGDKDRLAKLVKRYEVIFTPDGQYLVPPANNVDNSVFGILPMEIYRQNGMQESDKKWLDLGKKSADTEWQRLGTDGLTSFNRYWVDDMFMVTGLQAEAYRVTKDKTYLDRDAKEVVAYLKALQQPNGLFFHATDSPYCWGRGNGWFAVGMAEILSILPADHPDRPAILDGYKKMMAGLLKYQAKDGMWRQLIDVDDPANWDETSGTGMFVFAMALGVRYGWLDGATYKEPAKKAWEALATHIDPDGKVRDVCVGTNKAAQTIRAGPGPQMLNYYLTRQKATGDFHGQAAFIWAAWAMTMDPAK